MASVAAGYTTVDKIAGMFPGFSRPPAWRPDTQYDAGYTIRDSNGNQQQAPLSGGPFTSGSGSEPIWNTTLGQTTGDGPAGSTFVWTNQGGLPQDQSVSDTQIVTYALDVQGDIDAILQSRFSESISGTPYNGSFSAWLAGLTEDAQDVLESTCRYGAAAELGETLATLGSQTAKDFASRFRGIYEEYLNQLERKDRTGRFLAGSGRYDALFDPLAAHPSVRPALEGIAGGDQQPASLRQEGLNDYFGKWDRRGT